MTGMVMEDFPGLHNLFSVSAPIVVLVVLAWVTPCKMASATTIIANCPAFPSRRCLTREWTRPRQDARKLGSISSTNLKSGRRDSDNWIYGMSERTPDHSGLMPANWITFAHFSDS